jgi:hypothetical protein
VRVHPVYIECTAFGLNATITTTGCDYLIKAGTPTGSGWHFTTDIVCNAGSVIKIVTATCEVTIGGQTGLVTSELVNSGGSFNLEMDLVLQTDIEAFKYIFVKDGIGCPLTGTGSFSTGDYEGETTVKAHDSSSGFPTGITFH